MKSRPPARPPVHAAAGSAGEVFTAFLRLGLTSFGGPVAHLAYFRREFVERRAWMNESQFAQLLALCQFLPGPASSQLGASIGLLRAGWAGALAAFLAFTLPSAVLLFALAAWLPSVSGPVGDAALHGLKLVALAVVAQAVLGMARPLCPDLSRRAVAGLVLCRGVPAVPGAGLPTLRHGPALGGALLAVFALLLVGLPLLAAAHGGAGLLSVIDAFYRAGALVFGGGHVVLPWLEAAVVGPGWVSTDDFLAGYGAAQAVPGPMFTLAAYLGARLPGSAGGIVGASVALGAIFLPGLLLVTGVLPLWRAVAGRAVAARAIAGANAAVVGLLGAALYDPVWTGAVRGPMDIAIALAGVVLLVVGHVAPLLVVAWCVAASVVGAFWS